tara:strand:- start:3974 stop:4912 length:939 start_codon:yes stop_codon:yes gene_type:complete
LKITIIGPHSFGYIDFLVEKMREIDGVEATFINFDNYRLKYKSTRQKVENFFSKNLAGKNIKKEHCTKQVKKDIEALGHQDSILVIRPDKLQGKLLEHLKKKSDRLMGFYFDSITNFPKKAEIIPLFDKVFSYEPTDARDFNLEFVTNFIPFDIPAMPEGRGVFNVSSYDERFPILEDIAKYLKKRKYPYRIMVRSDKGTASKHVEIIEENIPLPEVKEMVKACKILLDVQKENQEGLTFRVFESLGLGKKLITTNALVKNYDFYNPNNILILDKEKIKIPTEFLECPYQPVPEEILSRYRRRHWIKTVFDI